MLNLEDTYLTAKKLFKHKIRELRKLRMFKTMAIEKSGKGKKIKMEDLKDGE